MKKVLLFLTISFMSIAVSAQQVYNGSFEYWSNPINPDGWGTWALAIAQVNGNVGDSLYRLAMKDTTQGNFTSDSASLRMVVDTVTLPSQGQVTLAGFVSLGGAYYVTSSTLGNGLQYGYYPYQKKPNALIFDYKYIPATAVDDSALVVMTMMRFDSLHQTENYYIANSWLLHPTAQWTHDSFPLPYALIDTFHPDSIQLIIFTSVSSHMHIGTTLWIDTIHFDASVNIIDTFTTGMQDIGNIRGINAYPNPANNEVNIAVEQAEIGSSIQLYDEEGRKAYDAIIDRQGFAIHTEQLPPGSYTIHINSTDKLTVYSGRISVIHDTR